MASEDTLIGNDLVLQLGDDASPPNYHDMCSVSDPGQLGEEKPLIDVTAQCDTGRTYRNGLADGVEFNIGLNMLANDADAAALYDAYDNDTVLPMRLLVRDSSPEEAFEFNVIVRAWNLTAPIGEKAARGFTLKVSGGVQKPSITP